VVKTPLMLELGVHPSVSSLLLVVPCWSSSAVSWLVKHATQQQG
jgi:hypothetical protein